MVSGRANFWSSTWGLAAIDWCREVVQRHTVVEVDAEMSPVRQRIEVHQVPLRIFYSLSLDGELLSGESPELSLRRLPVAGCHDGSVTRGRLGRRSSSMPVVPQRARNTQPGSARHWAEDAGLLLDCYYGKNVVVGRRERGSNHKSANAGLLTWMRFPLATGVRQLTG